MQTTVSLPQDTIHHETGTAARTNLIALSMVCAAVMSYKDGSSAAQQAVGQEDSKIIKLCRQSICKPGKLN